MYAGMNYLCVYCMSKTEQPVGLLCIKTSCRLALLVAPVATARSHQGNSMTDLTRQEWFYQLMAENDNVTQP